VLTRVNKRHPIYLYDQRNLQVERIFADTEDATDKVVFTYDASQRKTSQTDQAGVNISHLFDIFKELFSQRHEDYKEFK